MVDRWAYFFRETGHLKNVPPSLAQAPFARALEVARSSGSTPEEWEAYDRAKVAEQDARGALGWRSGWDGSPSTSSCDRVEPATRARPATRH
jgi:hypothetical protein